MEFTVGRGRICLGKYAPAAVTAFPSGGSTQTSLVLDREAGRGLSKGISFKFYRNTGGCDSVRFSLHGQGCNLILPPYGGGAFASANMLPPPKQGGISFGCGNDGASPQTPLKDF